MRGEYESRKAAREQAIAKDEQLSRQLSVYRLATVVVGGILTWWNFWLLPLPVFVFGALLVWHEKLASRIEEERRAVRFYSRGLSRLDGTWAGSGESGSRFQSARHPYSADLDVFGEGSLFQLLNAARTSAGEQELADWLQCPAEAHDVRDRQDAVRELTPMLDLREALALSGEHVRSALHPEALLRWGSAPPLRIGVRHRIAAALLSAGLLLSFSLWMLQLAPLSPVLVMILLELFFFASVRRRLGQILGAMEMPARELGVVAELVALVENAEFRSSLLASLTKRIQTEGVPASRQILKLQRLVSLRDQARNQMFAIIAEPLLWSVHFGFAIEHWREQAGPRLSDWLRAIGEVEALASLAGFAAERASYIFPEVMTSANPLFDAKQVAHPLLGDSAIANDVRLDHELQLLLVSGSNMSGKSTLMRAVGLNAVLAWAGAPVRCKQLSISRVAIGASMRLQDNLLEGASRFYAEITRLRQIVDMASGEPRLLFLLDELLSGTNSHDRLIGAEAVVKTLVARGAIGIVSTHDLALAHIADELSPRATNVHFEDHIEDGKIAFDYTMRPGVVQKSNAIELMRSVGIEV